MYKFRNIIIGLAIFAVLISIPFWYNAGKPSEPPKVSLDTATINALAEKECVEDVEFMRSNHMELLADWKVSVVRDGNRVYVNEDGQEYLMSLQNTCLDCHSNKEEFCDACHEYAEVEPNCWSCHVTTEEV